MSNFDDVAKQAARDVLMQHQQITYRGAAGDVSTYGMLNDVLDLLGDDVQVGDSRNIWTLLAEDVTDPRRGDHVVDEDGDVWILQEEQITSDRWFAEWSATRQ